MTVDNCVDCPFQEEIEEVSLNEPELHQEKEEPEDFFVWAVMESFYKPTNRWSRENYQNTEWEDYLEEEIY